MNVNVCSLTLLMLGLSAQTMYTQETAEDLGHQLILKLLAHDNAGARALINRGANVRYSERGGLTALMLAVRTGDDIEMVRMLVQKGADVNAKTNKISVARGGEATPLHYLAGSTTAGVLANFVPIADILLGAGAKINVKDEQGNTPLHQAVRRSIPPDQAQYLLDKHADPTIKNNAGELPVDLVSPLDEPLRRVLILGTRSPHYKKS